MSPELRISWVVETAEATVVDETWLPALEAAAAAALRVAGWRGACSLTIMLADDAVMRDLHREFLGDDRPTDVLSFPSGDEPGQVGADLGDLALSPTQARRQAEAAGHDPLAELQLLVVHGVLHLLGHDHGEPGEKAVMWRLQAAALDAVSAAVRLPT